MATINSLSQQLLDMLVTRNFHPEMLDRTGKPTDVEDAKTFTFDYVSGSGKNYGTMVIVLDSDNELKIMYGDNLGRTMEGDDKSEFFDFIQHINRKATQNRWTHSTADINQLKYTMQGMAAIQEGLFEGYYGTRKISYAGEPTQARLRIVHSQPLGENDARYRHVEKLFIETADGECFKLGFKSLSGARAMLEHVRQGGKPYDIRGCHITETVNEIAVLSRFNRASASRILEGVTQQLVTEAQQYYTSLRENLKHMATARGYAKYFESWHPATITEQEGVVDNIKTLFIEQSIDSRIEAALPLLAKIQQKGQEMKEVEIFENWINSLSEGTWSLPETPEQLDKLKTLMTKELIVGPDATNATEQLYDLIGDDELFDRLSELAARDPRANAWNDTEVMARIKELGIEMPEPTAPGNPAEPQTGATAPVAAQVPPNPAPQQPVAEEINAMRRAAGLPVVENQDPWGPRGRFAGDTHVDVGGVTMKKMQVGDTVKYLGQTAKVDAMSKDGKRARITISKGMGSVTQTVLTSDLTRLGQGVAEGSDMDQQAHAIADKLTTGKNLEKLRGMAYDSTVYRALDRYFEKHNIPETIYNRVAKIVFQRINQQGIEEGTGDYFIYISKNTAHEFEAWMESEGLETEVPKKEIGKFIVYDYNGQDVITKSYADDWNEKPQDLAEGRILDESGETLSHVLDRFKHEVKKFEQGADLDDDLYEALFDYYFNAGEMPYGTAKARTGDPYEWVSQRLYDDLGLNEGWKDKLAGAALAGTVALGAMGSGGTAKVDQYAPDINTGVKGSSAVIDKPNDRTKTDIKYQSPIKGQSAAIGEGTCNMTMEGEYCPEHGLAECGYMETAGGMGSGDIAPVMGEEKQEAFVNKHHDDPMNYNAAVTGSYYESKDGDALLARIKSLALLK